MGTGGIWEISVYFLQFFYELHAAFKKSFNLFKSYGYALSPRKSDLIEVSISNQLLFFQAVKMSLNEHSRFKKKRAKKKINKIQLKQTCCL